MKEIILEFENKHKIYFNSIVDELKKIPNILNVSVSNNIIIIKYNNLYKQQFLSKLYEILSNNIVIFYKYELFNKYIRLGNIEEVYKEALLKCLVYYDLENDIEYVKSQLDINYRLNIESFFIFKLRFLKESWFELVDLINLFDIYSTNNNVIDIIKYLINEIQPKNNIINVYFNGDSFVLSNLEGINVKLKNLSKGENEINLISTLIGLVPKKINLYCLNSISDNTFKIIYYIFDKKINLLV